MLRLVLCLLLTLCLSNLAQAQTSLGQTAFGNPLNMAQSSAAESSHIFKASFGVLYAASITNTNASIGFAMVFNAATVPADGAVTPVACFEVPASQTYSLPINYAIPLTNGVVIAYSSTGCSTKTTSPTVFIQAQFL